MLKETQIRTLSVLLGDNLFKMLNTHSGRSRSPSPMKSSSQTLPETHIIQDRYRSYHLAQDYINHLNNIYNSQVVTSGIYDEAYINAYKFRAQEPKQSGLFKVSQFPQSKVNKELLEQQDILNAFNHISFEARPRSKIRPKSTMPDQRRSCTSRADFNYKKARIDAIERCFKCHKSLCKCQKEVKDTFLKNILKRHLKDVNKLKVSMACGKEFRRSLRVGEGVKDFKTPGRANIVIKGIKADGTERKGEKRALGSREKERNRSLNNVEQSLCISPVSLSKRKESARKLNKLKAFKEFLIQKMSPSGLVTKK